MWFFQPRQDPLFPPWFNRVLPVLVVAVLLGGGYWTAVVVYGALPGTQRLGYEPAQPVDYSHLLHAGELGMDCRYCHSTVEHAALAAIPPTQTCMNCHSNIRTESNLLAPVRRSAATGSGIAWRRVHDLPGFVYFDHSVHVQRGVGCVSCHGRVDRMEKVSQVHELTMGWCLSCHRDPAPALRPADTVTAMDWVPLENQQQLGRELQLRYRINPATDCSTCHR